MLGDEEPPLRALRRPPEVSLLLLLSIGERYIFLFLLLLSADEERTMRLQKGRRASEFGGIFFLDRENMGFFIYKKLTCNIT